MGLWCAYGQKGLEREALQEAIKFFAALHDVEVSETLEKSFASGGYRQAMKHAADLLSARSSRTHVPGVRIARFYAHAGENELALQWLEKACEEKESPMLHLAVARDWDDLHFDVRFQELLRRTGLPR